MSQPLIGCILTRLDRANAVEWRRLVSQAEDSELDHLAVGDHVSFHSGVGADGLLAAATVLGASERLSTNTAVYLLPLRHPVLVARQLADISARAPRRFIFGVGIGGEDRHEVEVCGVDPRTRGRRMDECLQVIRQLLTGQPVDFDGDFVKLERAQIMPAIAEPIPIIVGGRSDAAIRRAGHYGDGWFGIWVSPRRFEQAVGQVHEAAQAVGRDSFQSTNALNVWCGVDESSDTARIHLARAMEAFYQMPYSSFEKWSPYGSTQQIADFLMPYVAAGCSLFNLIVNGTNAEAEIDAAAEIRRLILDGAR
jgi:alkanesulfonate monooxygenase SsuD/methylene tetrahydromethanopterin reductase-like flavin-dependent oxidoreductase (luciferase family)